jgi:hypothetical protein
VAVLVILVLVMVLAIFNIGDIRHATKNNRQLLLAFFVVSPKIVLVPAANLRGFGSL